MLMKALTLPPKLLSHKFLLFIGTTLLILILIGIVGSIVMAPTSKQLDNAASKQTSSRRVALKGQIVCLPHKNTEGPQTMECAFGLKTEQGAYYALEAASTSQSELFSIPTNTSVEVSGNLQSETSDIYQSTGKITVETIKSLE